MKMTLNSQTVQTSQNTTTVSNNERQIGALASPSNNRSASPNSSPRGSPKLSPRPQTKKDHSNRHSDSHLSVSYKECIGVNKQESQITSTDGVSASLSRAVHSANELSIPEYMRQDSANSSVKDHKATRSGTKKKPAWYSALYPTYKSRSEEFKKTFKDLPDDERLVVDYSSAMQKEILVHGRLYVSQNYFCFYANIFGWETNVTVKWRDVTAITKEKTALVIPNAILVSTRQEKYFLTSFVARDKTYLMLFRIWQNVLMDKQMGAKEMWHLVHQCYGEELGLTSDDEDYVAPSGGDDEKHSGRFSLGSCSEDCASNADATSPSPMDQLLTDVKTVEPTQPIPIRTHNSKTNQPLDRSPIKPKKLNLADMTVPTDMSDTSDSDGEKANPICTALHEGKQLMNEVIPMHVDRLFTLIFTASKFFLDFHQHRKTTDLSQTEWSYSAADGSKTRCVNLTAALNQSIGPRTAQIRETQKMLPCCKAGFLYSIDVETSNGGIPYADSFFVNVHFCLHKITENQSSIAVYAQLKYKKSVWGVVKNIIEKSCWAGLEDFYNSLAIALHAEAEDSVLNTDKRKVRVKQRSRIVQRTCSERTPNRSALNIIFLCPICNQNKCVCTPKNPVTGYCYFKHSRKLTFSRPDLGSLLRPAASVQGTFKPDFATIIVFGVLILLVILNILLYYKLWSLEESPPYSVMDLHLVKNPPSNPDDWIKLLRQQEVLHSVEMQKWQQILKTAIKLLKQTEESLNELQKSIHPMYTSKLMSALQSQQGEQANVKSTEL